ncbi:MAG: hypothetical protein AAGG01_03260 [Planctomycetota bacterium]
MESEVLFQHLVGDGHALQMTDALPLQIAGVSQTGDEVAVQLGGVSPNTRVHVIATRYLQPESALGALRHRSYPRVTATEFGGLFSTYESGREISDEYRYILDRRLIDPYPGNMLTRPGYLLNPWVLRDTADAMMAGGGAGGKFGGKRNLRAAGGAADSAADSPFDAGGQRSFAAPDFLASGAAVLVDLRPDGNGVVRIPIADLGDRHIVEVVAVDDTVTAAKRLIRGEAEAKLRERRLVDALDADSPMTQQRRIEFLEAGESFDIRDAPNAGAKTFGTLGDVFELYTTSGAGGDELAKFSFLTRWPSLEETEKLTKYSEFACHELHAFLRRKDPEFFARIVVPHLSSKGHLTFMDEWLLGRDLSGYLEPWRFAELNVVEVILLLRETGGEALRVVEDQLALLPPSAFTLDRSFAEILAVRGLRSSTAVLESALAETRKSAVNDKLRAIGYGGSGPSTPGPDAAAAPSQSNDFFLGRGEAESAARGRVAEAEEAIVEDFEIMDRNESDVALGVSVGRSLAQRKAVSSFYYRDIEDTQEYAETHYWRVPLGRMGRELVTVSPFWVDLARAGAGAGVGAGTFASTHFPLANRSVTEKLLALAFLDLPFDGEEAEVATDGRSVTLTAQSPMFLALEDIAPAKRGERSTSLLVGQDFFDPERRAETVDGVTRDVFVTAEFLAGRVYGCRMVVTNPSSINVATELLVQIPEGAIPLGDTLMTKGLPIQLGSYGTHSLETFFYFPVSGRFRDYPVHAGRGDELLGAADARTLLVVDELTEIDRTTWDWISQNAEDAALLEFLGKANVRSIDLDKIAWRMKERATFEAVTDALGRRGVFPDRLWRYAIRHRDPVRGERYLAGHESFVAKVGAPFRSDLLDLEPRERRWYEHLSYEPLVNGRVHEFAGMRKIMNAQFQAQYRRFLATVILDPDPSASTSLELVYYLLLQDRVGEALAVFDSVDASQLRERIQYDYMTAYMAFFRSNVAGARSVAERYADYPVELWRNRFRNVLAQADEIEGVGPGALVDQDSREDVQGTRAAMEPLLAIEVEGGEVRMSLERIDEVEVRYHRMDVEFLFSNSPFVRGGQGAFGVIQPSRIDRLAVPEGQKTVSAAIPDNLRTENLVIEVRGAGVSRQTTYFAGDLSVQGMERYGQIKVQASAGGAALPRAYVKVYALLENGSTRFHKDGYTDLRGRFDYVSLSGVTGSKAVRYAVLVMHGDAGASMMELQAPPR